MRGCRSRESTSFLWPEKKWSSLRTRQRKVSAASVDACSRGVMSPLSLSSRKRARAELGGAEPHRGVDVAQPARRLLHVRLADVGRGAVAAVALVTLGQGRLEKLGEVTPVHVLAQHATEPAEEPAVAGQEPRLLHRRAARKVGPRHRHAVVERAQAVADLKTQIPQRVEELLHHPLHVRRLLTVVDHHQVDVGEWMELTPTVAAEGGDHQRGRLQARAVGVLGDEPGQREDDVVHQAGVRANRFLPGRPLGMPHLQ